MKFFRHVLGTFLTEILTVGINFGLGVLLARWMAPTERGLLALAMLLPVTLAYFADIGVSQSIIYQLNRRKLPGGLVLGNSLMMAVLFGGLAAGALWAGRAWLLSSVLKDVPERYLLFALVLLPFLLMDAYLLSMLRGTQRFDAFNLRRLLTALLLLVGVVALVGGLKLGATGALYAFFISTLISLVLVFWIVLRSLKEPLYVDRAVAGESLRYGAKSYIQNLVGHLHYRVDVYLLALFLPPEQVAFYTVATSAAEFVFYIPDSVGTVLFPRLAAEGEDRIHQLTAEVTRHTLMITGAASLGLLSVGWWLIPVLYGEAYRPAVLPFMLLLPGMLAMAIYKVLTRNFTSRNRQELPVLAAALGILANVVLNLVLIPRLGVAGAALASLLSYTFLAGVLLFLFQRESRLPLGDVLIFRRSDLDRWIHIFHEGKRTLVRGMNRRGDVPEQVEL